jgi:hypothetical protein
MEATDDQRRIYAQNSLKENCENATFRKMFPELVLKVSEKETKTIYIYWKMFFF